MLPSEQNKLQAISSLIAVSDKPADFSCFTTEVIRGHRTMGSFSK